jgi:hypothetical protein
MIDMNGFDRLKNAFIKKSLRKYSFLKNLAIEYGAYDVSQDLSIHSYFVNLLGDHYVDKKD